MIEDKFYLDRESGIVRWMYYNPDSNAGGQYVENVFDLALIREAADTEDFFDYIGERCKQYLSDVGSEFFAEADASFKNNFCDFENCTKATQSALIAVANAELTNKRIMITQDNIEIDEELIIESDHVNAYVAALFDVDSRFGTQIHDTDDYLNVYANYDIETEELEVGYTLIKADGPDCDFKAVELADGEKDAILAKMKEAGLDECISEMNEDQDAGISMQ